MAERMWNVSSEPETPEVRREFIPGRHTFETYLLGTTVETVVIDHTTLTLGSIVAKFHEDSDDEAKS